MRNTECLYYIILLGDVTPFSTWMGAASNLEESYIATPLDLSAIPYFESVSLDTNYNAGGALRYFGNRSYVGERGIIRAHL